MERNSNHNNKFFSLNFVKNCISSYISLSPSSSPVKSKPVIPQCDGNSSLLESETSVIMPEGSSNIDVIVGNRPAKKNLSKRQRIPCRKTVRRDNRGQLALFFPNIAVYNHRSIWKKIKSFCTEFKELEMGAAFHSEVWEKKE